MLKNDDWQTDLVPRRIQYTKEAQVCCDLIKKDLDRGNEIFIGLEDFLKDCAHKGVTVHSQYMAQAQIPHSNQRVSCQYEYNHNTVTIHDVWVEDID